MGIVKILGFLGLIAALAGCTTEINVNGDNNRVDTSPAKYAGYGSTIDVLKGMSLPGIGFGGQSEKTPDETKVALPAVVETR
ncbi:MAG: hypothetical protein MJ033_01545 [Victivallaceae bacterium]|nr:hypothetical protein [Victivallaceae bacterium]